MDLIRDYFLEAHPNPGRTGCSDEQTLKALAEDRLPLEHPARLHLASCSECVAEYLGYRGEWREAQQLKPAVLDEEKATPVMPFPASAKRLDGKKPRELVYPIAACLLLLLGGVAYQVTHDHARHSLAVASSIPRDATVNLFEATTSRGAGPEDDAVPLQEVMLPAAVVRLSITLPRFSQSGEYKILVSTDRVGTQVIARGVGIAQESAGKINVTVTLDLRSAKPGAYFLATVRGSDNGTYYYPLQVH